MSANDDYIQDCLRTAAAGETYFDRIPERQFDEAFADFLYAGAALDYLKKFCFYGKDDAANCSVEFPEVYERLNTAKVVNTVHGILGIATESAELVELLTDDGPEPTREKIRDEVGDVLWYVAILLNANGLTFEECQAANIAKLRARFPEKFTAENAINRNLSAEIEAQNNAT